VTPGIGSAEAVGDAGESIGLAPRGMDGPHDQRLQTAHPSYIKNTLAAQLTLAENYVGLPMEDVA
jgi:hypothetical protein